MRTRDQTKLLKIINNDYSKDYLSKCAEIAIIKGDIEIARYIYDYKKRKSAQFVDK